MDNDHIDFDAHFDALDRELSEANGDQGKDVEMINSPSTVDMNGNSSFDQNV